jgi:hypothetical protein
VVLCMTLFEVLVVGGFLLNSFMLVYLLSREWVMRNR